MDWDLVYSKDGEVVFVFWLCGEQMVLNTSSIILEVAESELLEFRWIILLSEIK